MTTEVEKPVFTGKCDCCQREGMFHVYPDSIVIQRKQNGRVHYKHLTRDKLDIILKLAENPNIPE